jgi:hypothetical protein
VDFSQDTQFRLSNNTYRLVILSVLTLLSLACSLERFAFEYYGNLSKTPRYTYPRKLLLNFNIISETARMVIRGSATQARLEAMKSHQPPANLNVLPIASMALATHPKPFIMRNPAPFCGGADNLDPFLTHLKRLFKSHPEQFPRCEPDQVE